MQNDRDTIRESDMRDERMRDRNVTDKTGTMQRPRAERGEIRGDPQIDEDTTEEEATRSQIGAGE